MQQCFHTSLERGMSDSMQLAIDTQNAELVYMIVGNLQAAGQQGLIDDGVAKELIADARDAGYNV